MKILYTIRKKFPCSKTLVCYVLGWKGMHSLVKEYACDLYNKHVMVVIYKHSASGQCYKCVTIMIDASS
jgi:hypothetical protein